MRLNQFEKPVAVFVGLNFIREIETVDGANQFLAEWPAERRGAAHRTAVQCCARALRGETDAEAARAAFAAFARTAGVLASDFDPAIASAATKAAREWFQAA